MLHVPTRNIRRNGLGNCNSTDESLYMQAQGTHFSIALDVSRPLITFFHNLIDSEVYLPYLQHYSGDYCFLSQICPNPPGQKFEDPLFEEDILAFIRELGYPRDIKSLSDVKQMKESDVYKTYHDFATRKVIPKPKYVWRSTREKTDQAPIASLGKRLKATTKYTLENEGTGVSLRVPDVLTYGFENEQISWKSSDEDDDDEVSLSKDNDDNANNEDDDGQDDDNEQD
ncbi:hypothetical protein Tco_0132749 [Tanacetum coccineum]